MKKSPFKINQYFKKLNVFFNENDWSFGLFLLMVVAFVCDIVGFKMMFEENSLHGNWHDYVYHSIRVFGFELQTPNIDTRIPWVLELGRWLSAIATFWAVMLAVAHIFIDKINLFRKGKDHIVIIGAGSKGKALGLDWMKRAEDFSHPDHGKLFVFIETNKNNSNVDLLKSKKAIIIFGDATNEEILGKAKTQSAKYVIILTSNDSTNMEIVSTLTAFQAKIENKILCYVHLIHNEFYDFFMARDFQESHKLDVKIFSVNANSARILFGDRQNLLGSNIFTDSQKIKDSKINVKIAIFGFGKLGESILVHALHLGHFYNENPIKVTVVYDTDKDENANILDEFIKQYNIGIDKNQRKNTSFNEYWDIEFIDDGDFVQKDIGEYQQIIIAYENEFESLSNLMKILKKYNDEILSNDIDIAIYSNSFANTARVIQNDKKLDKHTVFKKVRTFGEIDHTCSYQIVINEELDKKAKLNNSQYNQLHGYNKENKTVEEQWNDLDVFLKDSNRYLMEHNEVKKYLINKLIAESKINNDYNALKKSVSDKFFNYPKMAINWDAMGLRDHDYALKLSEEEIVQLGKVEHKRWNAFHILNGWKKLGIPEGATNKIVKDKIRKLHPCLVGWDELDIVSKNHQHDYKSDDIETIMRIPSLDKFIGGN
ncbi:MAG: NAD-binding protein [Magnetococcus sp. DMHC-1]|nr:NAD-binding protein [Magnetococcales bacterium]